MSFLAKPSAHQPHALVVLLKLLGYGTGEPSAGTLITEAGFVWATILSCLRRTLADQKSATLS